jgi:NAD(P)-dependent dehydrogenase (short-subunit alcohol dehydrogenase family)
VSGYLQLEGKGALVTGGTKGVGAAVVAALREAGARSATAAIRAFLTSKFNRADRYRSAAEGRQNGT